MKMELQCLSEDSNAGANMRPRLHGVSQFEFDAREIPDYQGFRSRGRPPRLGILVKLKRGLGESGLHAPLPRGWHRSLF